MHGLVDQEAFLRSISGFLGAYYLALAMMNAVAAFYLWRSGRAKRLFTIRPLALPVTTAHLWLLVAVLFTVMAPIAMSGNAELMQMLSIPEALRDAFDRVLGPTVYSLGTLAMLGTLFVFRRFFVRPMVAWSMLNLALLLMGLSMVDPDFASIVSKPDNVPIVGMVYLLGFFTWLAAYRSVINDERMQRGEVPLEKLEDEKVLVWPDLVYIELVCMVALTALLLLWAIGLRAPLEEPANSVKTPNPSKAPWYFLGLQEMLVYYDPWMAGVVLPSLIIFGLMAIPFLDFNKQGSGYYTIRQRIFAYVVFQFGFLFLWVTLIVMGTFMRGPNWNFFGPYETWDAHKVEALNNVDLSEYFWVELMHRPRPMPPEGAGAATQLGWILLRESPGILALLLYFLVLPPGLVIGTEFFRRLFLKMGFIRFMVMTNLLLIMALLPIKMVARWTANLKYFVFIPEYSLNF